MKIVHSRPVYSNKETEVYINIYQLSCKQWEMNILVSATAILGWLWT